MLTDADRSLLSRPLLALMTVAPKGDRWPAPRPVWFELTGEGDLQIFSEATTPRVARVREVPRASMVVAAPVGEREHWVSVEGSVTVHDDGAGDLAGRLAERYYDTAELERQRRLIDGWRSGEGLVRIVLHPERVQRYVNE